MNASTTLAALENQAFALMGRLHVALRRQTGRVTDVEYMRIDPTYCRHVLDMAGAMPNEDLRDICAKLEEVYFGADGLFVRTPPRVPLLTRITAAPAPVAARPVAPPISAAAPPMQAALPESVPVPVASPASLDHGALVDQGYVGRLR
jgi:hypothetical protein